MDGSDEKLLFRTFMLEEFEAKKKAISILERLQQYNVACSRPIAVGKTANRGYMITSYIEGKMLSKKYGKCRKLLNIN